MTDAAPGPEIWTRSGPYRMTWSDLGELLAELHRSITADGFSPDAVCAVVRGAYVPAGYLAGAFDVGRLHLVRVRRTLSDEPYATKCPPALDVLTPDGLCGARRVLIVDDIVGSGATAHLVDRHIRQAGAAESRFAALAYNPRSTFRPDYRGVDVDDWIVFPWEEADEAVAYRALPVRAAHS